eukprot:GHVP01009229.1.p1 GENE.GHVP01009229.1~~GHVP01009229.1.p1  ORF type:complete len:208 (+),score=33.87 GHVP01009229.1:1-624(+)
MTCYRTLVRGMTNQRATPGAIRRLARELRDMGDTSTEGYVAAPLDSENMLLWEAYIMGPKDTPYAGGIFRSEIKFPYDYPLNPPTMKFTNDIYHPNIYENGEVCISILHHPGEDPHMYEDSCERWSPVQSVEKILLSVISILSEPNIESGANIDACKMWRDDKNEYNRITRRNVERSLELCLKCTVKTVALQKSSKMIEEAMKIVFE